MTTGASPGVERPSGHASEGAPAPLIRRHLVLGWALLLAFTVLGAVLEVLHGLKVGWYLDLGNATRRLMWTLAHAHGVLLGLVNLGFALTVHLRPRPAVASGVASASLIGSSLLLPGGFLLGGLTIHQGDPGVGVYLTPIGAALLIVAAVLVLRGLLRGGER